MAPPHTPVSPAPMPPLPPPPAVLPPALLELVDSLRRRLLDVETYQVPELAACHASLTLHEQLASGVRNELGSARRDIEELKLQCDELERARDRQGGMELVVDLQRHVNGITQLYRDAVLTSRRSIDSLSTMSAREELLAPSSVPRPNGKQRADVAPVSADDALMSATSDVTEGLRRTMQLMQQELDRSLISNEILESSTATMQMTSEQYSTFSTLLTTSKALITSLERADFLDRLILLFALIFFGLCCAWIFKRRVVDKGIKVASALGRVASRGGVKGEVGREVAEGVRAVSVLATAVVSSLTRLATPTPRLPILEHPSPPTPPSSFEAVLGVDEGIQPISGSESTKGVVVEPEEWQVEGSRLDYIVGNGTEGVLGVDLGEEVGLEDDGVVGNSTGGVEVEAFADSLVIPDVLEVEDELDDMSRDVEESLDDVLAPTVEEEQVDEAVDDQGEDDTQDDHDVDERFEGEDVVVGEDVFEFDVSEESSDRLTKGPGFIAELEEAIVLEGEVVEGMLDHVRDEL